MVSSISSPLTRRSRRNLTYREKLAIIHKKDKEPTWTQCNLALWAKETFRLQSKPTQATISNLLRSKDKLLKAAVPPEFRSSRRVKHPDLDRRMLLWVHQELLNGTSLTRLSIQTKAIDLAQEMKLSSDLTFSKGWVSSFTKRHQLEFSRKHGDAITQQETVRQGMLAVTAEVVKRAEQKQHIQEKEDNEEEEKDDDVDVAVVEMDKSVDVEKGKQVEKLKTSSTIGVAKDLLLKPSVKRRRIATRNDSSCSEGQSTSGAEKRRTTADLLLDWIAVPGSYSRWWLLKRDEEKETLCDEINLFLRSHGLRKISSVDIRLQLTAFVTTFQAANNWLRQAKVEYPSNIEELTFEQECTKRHVLQMCRHYERLVSVLAAYVDYDNCTVHTTQSNEALATSTGQKTIMANGDAAPVNQAPDATIVVVGTRPKLTTKSWRQSTDIDDETKAQKRRLFELECARLQSEIETRNIQLVLEKTLARKKLLDAGIPTEEVNRIFPL